MVAPPCWNCPNLDTQSSHLVEPHLCSRLYVQLRNFGFSADVWRLKAGHRNRWCMTAPDYTKAPLPVQEWLSHAPRHPSAQVPYPYRRAWNRPAKRLLPNHSPRRDSRNARRLGSKAGRKPKWNSASRPVAASAGLESCKAWIYVSTRPRFFVKCRRSETSSRGRAIYSTSRIIIGQILHLYAFGTMGGGLQIPARFQWALALRL
jgi:hypothetical protein